MAKHFFTSYVPECIAFTVYCFSKIQIGFTFLVPAHPGSPGQSAVERVCVCVPECHHVILHVNVLNVRSLNVCKLNSPDLSHLIICVCWSASFSNISQVSCASHFPFLLFPMHLLHLCGTSKHIFQAAFSTPCIMLWLMVLWQCRLCLYTCIVAAADVGGLGWFAAERISWNTSAAQAVEGDQEETRPQDTRHDKENQWWWVQELLERIQHQVNASVIVLLLVVTICTSQWCRSRASDCNVRTPCLSVIATRTPI